jgi:hypothetical protein
MTMKSKITTVASCLALTLLSAPLAYGWENNTPDFGLGQRQPFDWQQQMYQDQQRFEQQQRDYRERSQQYQQQQYQQQMLNEMRRMNNRRQGWGW